MAEEPTVDMESIMTRVMFSALSVNDHETIETLFAKLSHEHKKGFLYGAATMASDKHATKFLAHLTLLLFEESAKETQCPQNLVIPGQVPVSYPVIPAQAGIQTNEVHTAPLDPRLRGGDGKKAKGEKLVKSYYVGDFVPMSMGGELNESKNTSDNNMAFGRLSNIIMQVVKPDSWNKENGGEIAAHFATKSLAIRQTEEVHEQIEDLLNQMRQINAAHESGTAVR